jgi:probable HAF family extracellular repeat protein
VVDVVTTELGTLGGKNSHAADINDRVSVVGWAENANGLRRAVLWRAGSMLDIGMHQSAFASEALGINAHDQVTGFWDQGGQTFGFRWWGRRAFEPLSSGSTKAAPVSSRGVAINAAGEVVGQRAPYPTGAPEATLWTTPTSFHTIYPTPYFGTLVYDVNDRTVMAGRSLNTLWSYRWDWNGASATGSVVPRPGNTYNDGYVAGVNNANEFVGYFETTPYTNGVWSRHAFLWDGNSLVSQDLGLLPTGRNSEADDVNGERFVAGYADRIEAWFLNWFPIYVEKAYLYHADFGFHVLPQPAGAPWLGKCRATALNERQASGVISVVGTCDAAGGSAAIRWDVLVDLVYTRPGQLP